LRLLHFLALAVLVAWFVPRDWRGLTTAVMRGAILCGQNSLPIYCLGVLLTLASHLALLDISEGLMMQIALSVGGVLVMVVAATLLNSIKIKPRQQPHAKPADLPVEQQPSLSWSSISRQPRRSALTFRPLLARADEVIE
jgi:hypothetical protein